MEETPKPSWLQRVIPGGKSKDAPAGKAESTSPQMPEGPAATEGHVSLAQVIRSWRQKRKLSEGSEKDSPEVAKEAALVELYHRLVENVPADFGTKVERKRVQEHSAAVASWTVDTLHAYLSGIEVFVDPSRTRAVFNEIDRRMLLDNMSPRR
jgi:hypothetical protein